MSPDIKWIKNDPEKHKYFTDGSKFLVAILVGPNGGPYTFDFDVVETNADGEGMDLTYSSGEPYDAWLWDDFEYFVLLRGEMPRADLDEE